MGIVSRVRAVLRFWRSRIPLWRMFFGVVGVLFALQAATVAVLSIIVARRREQRRPIRGFPYLTLPEVGVGTNRLRIYSYGDELYDAMIAAIESAKERIYFETYLWKDDEVGRRFKERLHRKALEGVEVYVIFDGFGNLVVDRAFKQFPPEIRTMRYRAIQRFAHIFDPRRYALDHRKLLVVDGRIAFIGGYNIGNLYATEWRDTHLRIRGQAAADLADSFLEFWNSHSHRKQRIQRRYGRRFDPLINIKSNDALRLTFPIRDMYIEAIDQAERYILLTNAYFIPDHTVLSALKAAVARGVDVQVLLPWTSNHILADWAARGYFTDCLKGGIRIFGYKRAMVHAKTCTIDGQWSTIGTANLDRLSSIGNYEINMEIYSPELARQMEDIFACDKTNAFELTLDQWIKRPWYVEMSEQILAPLRLML
ncbi:MAG: putative phospholipase D family protein [Ktedonobacterales bacterium]|jgi:cardiolipin synthase|nr:MAG: putative phospholipase D family protein [Ktedonobacterales bacterium]